MEYSEDNYLKLALFVGAILVSIVVASTVFNMTLSEDPKVDSSQTDEIVLQGTDRARPVSKSVSNPLFDWATSSILNDLL